MFNAVMDMEIGSNTGVIISLMDVDDRPMKKIVQGHKRVLSDKYHQKVASTAWHVRLSSIKCNSFGMSKDCESSEASAAISQNKRFRRATEVEAMSDIRSDEKNALGGKDFIDELLSETYTCRCTTRQSIALNNSCKPPASFTGRHSSKRLLGNSYMGSKDGKYIDYWLKNHNGCPVFSRSFVRNRDSETRNEALHRRYFIMLNSLHRGETDRAVCKKSNLEYGPPEQDSVVELFSQKSLAKVCSTLGRNGRHPLDDHDIEQETSPKESADSLYTDGSSIEMDSFKSLVGNYLRSPDSVLETFEELKPSEVTTSTAGSSEGGAVSVNEDSNDHCEAGCCEQDSLKHRRTSENREFNYLLEVITTAGFCTSDLTRSLGKWHSVESPLSPFIFEAVEKRYADEKSWQMSERLLLFDRINSWLEGTLCPSSFVSSGHITARIGDRFRQLSADVLWSSLVKEGRELHGETIEDLLRSNLGSVDIGEFVESMVNEIEHAVVDDLAAEFVGE